MASRASAANRVLIIHELLSLICLQAEQATRAMMSRVCRSWHEIASNELWRELGNVSPLFSILAPLEGTGIKEFTRPLYPEDWERFLPIAKRVRKIIHSDMPHIDSSVFQEIASTRPVLDIFPYLQTLDVESEDPSTIMDSIILLTPSLTKLALRTYYEYSDPSEGRFIAALHRLPNLKEIEFYDCIRSTSALEAASRIVQQLDGLKTLKIHAPSNMMRAVFHLASHQPHLQTFTLVHSFTEDTDTEVPPSPSRASLVRCQFPSLEELRFDRVNGTQIRAWTASYPLRALRKLHIEFNDDDAILPQNIFAYIPDSSPKLEEISLTTEEGECPSITYTALEPLVTRIPLRVFKIEQFEPSPFDLSELEKMAAALGPSIVELSLNPNPGDPDDETLPSLMALVPFAKHCKRLESFAICLDARTPAVPPVPPVTFCRAEMTIDFGRSPIGPIFNAVKFLQCMGCGVKRPSSTWKDVADTLQFLEGKQSGLIREHDEKTSKLQAEIHALRHEIDGLKLERSMRTGDFLLPMLSTRLDYSSVWNLDSLDFIL